MEVLDDFPDHPVPLVEIVEDAEDGKERFKINEEATAILQRIPGKVAVVAMCGLYRTGKSSLLNWLLDRKSGFAVGPTVQACTKGIWIWGRPKPHKFPNGEDGWVLMLDTEGLGGVEANQQYDARVFSLATLLCSKLIYNSLGSVDESAISNLSFIANLTKHIRIKAQTETGDEEEDESQAFQDFFPSFLWVVRDFSLELEDENGDEITPSQYLEKALAPQPGLSPSIMERNRLRQMLAAFFTNRDCYTLIRPVHDEQALQQVDLLDMTALREDFVQQLGELKTGVYGQLGPKTLNNRPLNGAMFVGLCQAYIDAINGGGVPTISSAWEGVTLSESRAAMGAGVEVYKTSMDAVASTAMLPLDEAELAAAHAASEQKALEAYKRRAVGDAAKKFQAQMLEQVLAHYTKLRGANTKASFTACSALLQQLFSEGIQAKLSNEGEGSYRTTMESLDQVREDFAAMRESYMQQAKGPEKDTLLVAFIEDKIGEVMRLIFGRLQEKHEEQIRAKEAEVAVAQEKLALQSGKEESFKKMLADAQEAQSKLMGLKAKLQAAQTSNEATIAEQKAQLDAQANMEEKLQGKEKDLVGLRQEFDTLVKEKEEVDNRLAQMAPGSGASVGVSERPPKACCTLM